MPASNATRNARRNGRLNVDLLEAGFVLAMLIVGAAALVEAWLE